MLTLLLIVAIILSVLFIIGIGIGIVAISPLLAVILALPLIDLIAFKIYRAIKKKSKD